ncbi:GNAT family N-acetyltransferase [Magnetospirillum sp. SS-4]|uniref:GNAT family N-acetyltransferase n=1 Tax=Magnetospirillum sp. SS-4 TaxID=2681465 RepID=UPI0013819BBC|nr:GNAT family N-acetyltransferase [Magnetospirillum sp. SS-4]CAA7612627.1 Histone acetyltransferase HPA2 and related acetyltransferase [Magnetospirillum sp. SS-4]
MLIRRLYAHERRLYADHLKRLSDSDRRLRFAGGGMTDARIDAHVAGIDGDALILAALDGEMVVGAAHVSIAGAVAEVGVSVDSGHRTGGTGSDLLRQAVAFARNRRAEKLYTLCLSDNRAMMALARRTGMTLHADGGEAEAFLDLPPPDAATLCREASTGLFAVFHDWAELVEAYGEALSQSLPAPQQPDPTLRPGLTFRM